MLNFKFAANRFDVNIDIDKELPTWLSGAVIGGMAALLLAWEHRRTLRTRQREPKLKHDIRNLVIAAGAGLVMQCAERPTALYVARQISRRKWGLAPLVARNRFAQILISITVLDYGLYLWHVLTHRVPGLWKFHLVHHIDLDMDATTALRFHFGEIALSVPWRLGQIVVAGASPLSLSLWQTLLFASILFHHSNIRLPETTERFLSRVIMTPRLHGLHHQADPTHTHSNWSSGLALWDLIHRTWRWPTDEAPIGVPAYQRLEDARLLNCAALPFMAQRDDWVAKVQRP